MTVLAVSDGWLDGTAPEDAPALVQVLLARARAEEPAAMAQLERGELPAADALAKLAKLCAELRAAQPSGAGDGARPAAGVPA